MAATRKLPTALPASSSPIVSGESIWRVNPALSTANWFIHSGITAAIDTNTPKAASMSAAFDWSASIGRAPRR
jgi:hypothetical protein